MSLNNISFHGVSYKNESEDTSDDYTYGLIIVNTFQDIDLDKSNIKNKPKKIFYLFDDIKGNNIINGLNNFVGSSSQQNNPIFINILEYMGIPYNKKFAHTKYGISKYMKLSDYFFSFYLEKRKINWTMLCSYFLAMLISLLILLALVKGDSMNKSSKIIALIVFIIIIVFINLIFAYCFIKIRNKYIKRIDIVFSLNFDEVFLGLVNYNEESYIDTFLFDFKLIEKFYALSNSLYVEFKNKSSENIIQFKNGEPDATIQGLLFILNEKLNNKNEQKTNNNNLLVKTWE